jgi:hypothetical protein
LRVRARTEVKLIDFGNSVLVLRIATEFLPVWMGDELLPAFISYLSVVVYGHVSEIGSLIADQSLAKENGTDTAV